MVSCSISNTTVDRRERSCAQATILTPDRRKQAAAGAERGYSISAHTPDTDRSETPDATCSHQERVNTRTHTPEESEDVRWRDTERQRKRWGEEVALGKDTLYIKGLCGRTQNGGACTKAQTASASAVRPYPYRREYIKFPSSPATSLTGPSHGHDDLRRCCEKCKMLREVAQQFILDFKHCSAKAREQRHGAVELGDQRRGNGLLPRSSDCRPTGCVSRTPPMPRKMDGLMASPCTGGGWHTRRPHFSPNSPSLHGQWAVNVTRV